MKVLVADVVVRCVTVLCPSLVLIPLLLLQLGDSVVRSALYELIDLYYLGQLSPDDVELHQPSIEQRVGGVADAGLRLSTSSS